MGGERREEARAPIPREERRSALGLGATTAAWIITMSTLYTGGVLARGLGFGEMLAATLLGMGILWLVGLAQGWTGAARGLTTSDLAAGAFGVWGGRVFGVLIAFVLGLGWFGWQLSFFGNTVAAYWEGAWLAEPKVAMTWGAVLMTVTTVVGYRALSALSTAAVPLIVILSIWGIALAVDRAGGWSSLAASRLTGEPIGLIAGIGLVVGNGIIGAIVFPDLARFARSGRIGGLAAASGYFVGGVFLILAGATITYAVPDSGGDLPGALREIGFGLAGFLILLLAQWTTNNNNLYSGSLGLDFVIGHGRTAVVIGMAVLGLAIALAGIEHYFVPLLNFLGTFFPPFAGVMIADAWVARGATSRRRLNPAAAAAATAGIAAALALSAFPAPVTGLVTATFVYTMLAPVLAPRRAES